MQRVKRELAGRQRTRKGSGLERDPGEPGLLRWARRLSIVSRE